MENNLFGCAMMKCLRLLEEILHFKNCAYNLQYKQNLKKHIIIRLEESIVELVTQIVIVEYSYETQ